MKNTEKVVEMAKQKSARREAEVLAAIQKMTLDGDAVTFYSVAKKTGAAKSYLYANETLRRAIEEARKSKPEKYTGSKVVIDGLKRQVKSLESENARLRALDAAKLQAENAALKRRVGELELRLRSAYSYSEIFNPYGPDLGSR